ncbi:MAG TPA: hypothetical protein VGD46_13450 [Rhizobacter sp.]
MSGKKLNDLLYFLKEEDGPVELAMFEKGFKPMAVEHVQVAVDGTGKPVVTGMYDGTKPVKIPAVDLDILQRMLERRIDKLDLEDTDVEVDPWWATGHEPGIPSGDRPKHEAIERLFTDYGTEWLVRLHVIKVDLNLLEQRLMVWGFADLFDARQYATVQDPYSACDMERYLQGYARMRELLGFHSKLAIYPRSWPDPRLCAVRHAVDFRFDRSEPILTGPPSGFHKTTIFG